MRMSYWISDVCSSDLVRGAVRFGRRLVVIAFEHLVYARFARPEQAVIAVAGFARAHRRGELGENAFEFLLLARLQIGRASCRVRVCHYVRISVVAGSLTKKLLLVRNTKCTHSI